MGELTIVIKQTAKTRIKNSKLTNGIAFFPQQMQSHKTLANSLRNRTEKTKTEKISSLKALLNKSNRIWN